VGEPDISLQEIEQFLRKNPDLGKPVHGSYAADAVAAKFHCVDPMVHRNSQFLQFTPLDHHGNLSTDDEIIVLAPEVQAYCEAESTISEGQLTAMRALSILSDMQGGHH
jgi:hypothetical protein